MITRNGRPAGQALMVAAADSLLERLRAQYDAVKTVNATVDMVPALGSVDKGKITEYKDVRAYVLYRAANDIRIIGLYPVVRSKAFDMTSDGSTFRLFLPSRNRFLEGRNEVIEPSANKLENLRPQHFLDALIVKPAAEGDRPMLINLTDEASAHYILTLTGDDLIARRQIWFDRVTLDIARQLIFDRRGDILTDARYSEWKADDRVRFPSHIEVNRPKDEYGVVMSVVKMEINKPLDDGKFVLDRPEGVELRIVGAPPAKPEGK